MFIFLRQATSITEEDVKAGFKKQPPKTDIQLDNGKIAGTLDPKIKPIMIAYVENKDKKNDVADLIKKARMNIDDAVSHEDMTTEEGNQLKQRIAREKTIEGVVNVFKLSGYDNLTESKGNNNFDSVFKEAPNREFIARICKDITNDPTKTQKQKEDAIADVKNAKTNEDVINALNKHGFDNLAREFVDWVQQAYEDNLRKLLGSKIKLKSPSPSMLKKGVEITDKFTNEGTKASEAVAREHSPLKTLGLEYAFERDFDVGSSFD